LQKILQKIILSQNRFNPDSLVIKTANLSKEFEKKKLPGTSSGSKISRNCDRDVQFFLVTAENHANSQRYCL
jgi:hypothetical protein